jgi:hypothetical protein
MRRIRSKNTIMSKDNLFIEVNKCLRYLDNAGWSDLIDSRWKEDVVKELKHNFPNISDEVIEKVLELVLV